MFWDIYHQHSSTTFRSCRTWIPSPFWGTGHQSDRCPLQKPKNHDSETKMCDSETKMCDSETNIYDSETKMTDSATKTEATQKPKRTNSETKKTRFRSQNVRLRNQMYDSETKTYDWETKMYDSETKIYDLETKTWLPPLWPLCRILNFTRDQNPRHPLCPPSFMFWFLIDFLVSEESSVSEKSCSVSEEDLLVSDDFFFDFGRILSSSRPFIGHQAMVLWGSHYLVGYPNWLVVWSMTFFPYVGNNHPNWLSSFSEGLKPPTSQSFIATKDFVGRDLEWSLRIGDCVLHNVVGQSLLIISHPQLRARPPCCFLTLFIALSHEWIQGGAPVR
jgi:hypothetical protein